MACTRFNYDDARTHKALQQSTDVGRWILNVPGNGDNMPYMLDPHIIPQKWAGNLMTNTINLESDLMGVNRRSNRDCLGKDNYEKYNVSTSAVQYPTSSALTTDQSRTTNPAWWYRDVEQSNWDYTFLNHQANVCLSFQNNVSTRIVEKDTFTPKRVCVLNNISNPSYSLIK